MPYSLESETVRPAPRPAGMGATFTDPARHSRLEEFFRGFEESAGAPMWFTGMPTAIQRFNDWLRRNQYFVIATAGAAAALALFTSFESEPPPPRKRKPRR